MAYIPKAKDSTIAIVALIVNIFTGGIGTLIAAIMTEDGKMDTTNVIIGIIQTVLTFTVGFGWIWGIIWGILIFIKQGKK